MLTMLTNTSVSRGVSRVAVFRRTLADGSDAAGPTTNRGRATVGHLPYRAVPPDLLPASGLPLVPEFLPEQVRLHYQRA